MTTVGVQAIKTVSNFRVPCEGAEVLSVQMDFSVPPDGIFTLDLTQYEQQQRFSMVQSLFVDMTGAGGNMLVSCPSTRQTFTAKNNTAGFYTMLADNPTVLTFQMSAATPVLTVLLINSPIPGVVWATT